MAECWITPQMSWTHALHIATYFTHTDTHTHTHMCTHTRFIPIQGHIMAFKHISTLILDLHAKFQDASFIQSKVMGDTRLILIEDHMMIPTVTQHIPTLILDLHAKFQEASFIQCKVMANTRFISSQGIMMLSKVIQHIPTCQVSNHWDITRGRGSFASLKSVTSAPLEMLRLPLW